MALNLDKHCKQPLYYRRSNYKLLTEADVVARWLEPNRKPGIRFGGVCLLRIEGTDHCGYVFAAGNEMPVELCPRHNSVMSLELVKDDTDHNVKRAAYYYCDTIYIQPNGRNIQCGENVWPMFPKHLLVQLLANPDPLQRPKIVKVTV